MGVKGREAAWAFMILRQNNPRPRTRFSLNSSGTMCFMFETLILLISPLIDFFRASQAMRWYSLLVLSVICDCSARNFAGGIYVPPDRIVSSVSYSAFAEACFSSAVKGFRLVSSDSFGLNLASNSRSRSSISRSCSPPFLLRSPLGPAGGGRRRVGEGDRDGGDLFLAAEGPGEYEPPGGGVGRRTADDSSIVSAMVAVVIDIRVSVDSDRREPRQQPCRRGRR